MGKRTRMQAFYQRIDEAPDKAYQQIDYNGPMDNVSVYYFGPKRRKKNVRSNVR